MDFSFTEEQTLLKDSFQRFLQDAYGFEDYRKIIETEQGYSADTWAQMGDLQWQGLPFSDADGGLGYGHIELLPGLMDGSRQISLAHVELAGRYQTLWCETQATQQGDSWVLNGRKSMVLNAPNAAQLLVLARTSGNTADAKGLGLFLIDANASGVTLSPNKVLGGGVGGELSLDNVSAQRLGDEAGAVIEDVIDLGTAYTCADAYGAMQALLGKTVEYSKTRKQFGMPLGAFQALQHRMVDMFIEVQQSQSMILMLMLRLSDDDRAVRQHAVSACKAYMHKASKYVAQQAVQLHGGIGVTEELDIGHYFRRLTAFGSLYGDRTHHLRRIAALDKAQRKSDGKLASAA